FCRNVHRPDPLSRHLLSRRQLEVSGTDHGARQKRSHVQAESSDQGSARITSDAAVPRVAPTVRDGKTASATDGNQSRGDLSDPGFGTAATDERDGLRKGQNRGGSAGGKSGPPVAHH